MFIDNIQSVQMVEGIVPSAVWLKPFDDRKSVGANAFNLLHPVTKKVGAIPAYWEARIIGGRSAIVEHEDGGKMIEGGSKIVDAIADDGSPLCRDGLSLSEAVGFCSNMRFFLQNDEMTFSCFEGVDGRAQIRKVFFGPINLYADAAQRIGHGA